MVTTVEYYRINANNTQLATSNSGTGNGSAPTEEITTPVAAGTVASASTTTVTAQAATLGALSPGQYLYRISGTTGEYILMGQIDTIAGNFLSLTLTANFTGGAVTAGETLAGSYSLVTTTESIYMRIATIQVNDTIVIPDFRQWRNDANNDTGLNNTTYTTLEQVSAVGSPITPLGSVVPIPFTIRTMNVFTYASQNSVQRAWASTGQFPSYMWIRVTPSNTTSSLASKTLYRWTTQESFPDKTYGAGTNGPTVANLQAAGYNTSGTTTQGPPSGQ